MHTAPVGLHPSTYGLGRNTCADLNVRFLNHHACRDGLATGAAEWRCEHPLLVRLG